MYSDHNEYSNKRRMSDRNDEELYIPSHLNLNYQHLPSLLQQLKAESQGASATFPRPNEREIISAANEYLIEKYQQLQNAKEKRKGPKKVRANNYPDHVIHQYSDNQYPSHHSKSPHPKQAEKPKYLSQTDKSPNKYNYRNGTSDQSKDPENHDSPEYLSLTHLQMSQKYLDKKWTDPRYGTSDRDQSHHTQPPPALQPYQVESVEKYVGNSGKEYETAAEKIVEGYMGEYMEKYMNEWYIKYCKETGKERF